MKRSEIQKLIETRLYELNVDSNGATEMIGEKILQALEEAGMQPPSIKEPCETWVLINGKHVRTEDSFVFTHKWDEE